MIIFDNLIQPHSNGIVGRTQRVRAMRPSTNQLNQASAGNTLYRPVDIVDVSHRAQQAGAEFRRLFQS